ncbi:hypothetical protein FOL47_010445 [Perkinsus chesapeaki]|uniref:Aluminum-activated malate transporter 1 n=1 Tax=Perkinsus chesapeaki TaxID=330153 RepID=A0A7J6MQD1_PERCH|nr:hypothetical protein FOL47_010445 [Perkinsus chesapeaki]
MLDQLPSIPIYKLLTAMYTGLLACLCSWAVFIMPGGRGANITVLAPVWALITAFLNISANYDQSLRSLVGAALGLFNTELVALLVTVCSTTGYNAWIGVIVSFPLTFLLAIGDPASGSKLCNVFRSDVAMECMYIPLAFPNGQPFYHGLLTSGAFAVGSAETFIATTILNAFNLLPRSSVPAIPAFARAAADYFETLATYVTSGTDHLNFIDRQRAQFDVAWRAAAKAAPNPKIRSIIYQMSSELIALRQTLRDGGYSQSILHYIWHPLVPDLVDLRLEVVYWLRQTAVPLKPGDEIDATELLAMAEQVQGRLTDESLLYSKAVVSGESDLSPANDIVRFQFAFSLIAHFAVLADEFHTLVRDYEMSLPEKTKRFDWWGRLTRYLSECKKYWIHWWHLPFWAYGNMTLRQRLTHPLRLSLSITLFALPLIAWAQGEPVVESYGFWGLVPLLFCLLPTPGASLVKGTKRIIGTLLAAVTAIICVSANPRNIPAYEVEMFVVVTLGKLASLYSSIDYAGTVFAFTWMIIGIIPSLNVTFDRTEMIYWSLWRVALTLIGTFGGTLITCFIFPTFAMTKLDKESAHELLTQADMVASSIEELCRIEKGPAVNPDNRRYEVGDAFWKSCDTRTGLTPEARAEALVLGKTSFVDDTTRAVIKIQGSISCMGRSALVAHATIADCTRSISEPAISLVLDPLREQLSRLSAAIRDSSSKVALQILDDHSSKKMIVDGDLVGSQVNVEMQNMVDHFVEIRKNLLSGEDANLDGFTKAIRAGLYTLYHSFYTLRLFTDDWVKIETVILGYKELSPKRTRAFSGAPQEMVNRARAHIKSVAVKA